MSKASDYAKAMASIPKRIECDWAFVDYPGNLHVSGAIIGPIDALRFADWIYENFSEKYEGTWKEGGKI